MMSKNYRYTAVGHIAPGTPYGEKTVKLRDSNFARLEKSMDNWAKAIRYIPDTSKLHNGYTDTRTNETDIPWFEEIVYPEITFKITRE